MNRKQISNAILFIVFLCGCLPLGTVGAVFAFKNRDTLYSMVPSINQGTEQPSLERQIVNSILTPGGEIDTPVPGATDPAATPVPPTPTQQNVDKLRTLAPKTADFQSIIRAGNVIQGKNVLLGASGTDLYGYGEYYDGINKDVPFPFSFLIGTNTITQYDATFRATVAVNIDEGVYLPAILSQAVVLPDLTAPPEKVVINQGTPQEEVVEMQPGVVTLPLVSTCWTGFGIQPWEQRFESGTQSRYANVRDSVYWQFQALMGSDQNLLTWALPRVRFAGVRAAYNAILPIENNQRSWAVLDEIHRQTEVLITTSSGEGNVPSINDLLLGYFNLRAHEYNFSRITAVNVGMVTRGNVYCASNTPLWDMALESTLSGSVPTSFLLNPDDLQPELPAP